MYGSTDRYNVLTKISPSLHSGISILSTAKLDSVGTLSTPGRLWKTILEQVSDADSAAIVSLLASKGMGREQNPSPRRSRLYSSRWRRWPWRQTCPYGRPWPLTNQRECKRSEAIVFIIPRVRKSFVITSWSTDKRLICLVGGYSQKNWVGGGGGGVRPAFQNLYPIYGQNSAIFTLVMTGPQINTLFSDLTLCHPT